MARTLRRPGQPLHLNRPFPFEITLNAGSFRRAVTMRQEPVHPNAARAHDALDTSGGWKRDDDDDDDEGEGSDRGRS